MDKTEEAEKWGVSYHEAGHAIVAIDLGWSVSRVRIFRGQEQWKGDTSVPDAATVDIEQAAFFAAGMISQEIGQPDSANLLSDQVDMNKLAELADKQLGECALIGAFALPEDRERRDLFVRQAELKATEIIQRRWDHLKALAVGLFRSHQFEQQAINDLLSDMKKG